MTVRDQDTAQCKVGSTTLVLVAGPCSKRRGASYRSVRRPCHAHAVVEQRDSLAMVQPLARQRAHLSRAYRNPVRWGSRSVL